MVELVISLRNHNVAGSNPVTAVEVSDSVAADDCLARYLTSRQ